MIIFIKITEYKKIIEKYEEKYNFELEKCKNNLIDCMKEYDKEQFIKCMYNYRKLIKELILEIINEFEEFKKIKCCILINGSLARGTNTLHSDIDINYFYDNKNFEQMINLEEKVNYILQTIMKYRGKDRIHSMVVYLPLIRNNKYEFINNNNYPIYFEDGIINNKCRENAEQLMYETYNSTREIDDLINYLNENDNENYINEWTNCFELIYDNNLYQKFIKKRKINKNTKNIKNNINDILKSINEDNNYINNEKRKINIKDLKYFYKMLTLNNAYKILALYFRINSKFNTINIKEFEEKNIGLPQDFYDSFYKYLNLIQKLQYLLDKENMDLSYHSTQTILKTKLNNNYKKYFNSNCLIEDLNKAKYEFYEICKNILKKEVTKYE